MNPFISRPSIPALGTGWRAPFSPHRFSCLAACFFVGVACFLSSYFFLPRFVCSALGVDDGGWGFRSLAFILLAASLSVSSVLCRAGSLRAARSLSSCALSLALLAVWPIMPSLHPRLAFYDRTPGWGSLTSSFFASFLPPLFGDRLPYLVFPFFRPSSFSGLFLPPPLTFFVGLFSFSFFSERFCLSSRCALPILCVPHAPLCLVVLSFFPDLPLLLFPCYCLPLFCSYSSLVCSPSSLVALSVPLAVLHFWPPT